MNMGLELAWPSMSKGVVGSKELGFIGVESRKDSPQAKIIHQIKWMVLARNVKFFWYLFNAGMVIGVFAN